MQLINDLVLLAALLIIAAVCFTLVERVTEAKKIPISKYVNNRWAIFISRMVINL